MVYNINYNWKFFFLIPVSFLENFSILIYGIGIILLILLFPFGSVINGAKAWFKFGIINLQPVEIVKFGITLIFSYCINSSNFDFNTLKSKFQIFIILLLPIILIILQPDMGSVLVLSAFFIVLYREGFPGIYFIIGLYLTVLFLFSIYNIFYTLKFLIFVLSGLIIFYIKNYLSSNITHIIFSLILILIKIYILFILNASNLVTTILFFLSLIFTLYLRYIYEYRKKYMFFYILFLSIPIIFFSKNIFAKLPKHQKERIIILFEGETKYRNTSGYNLLYSKTSIGSGGFWGKGFNQGTITDGKFVPEQHTDYIFSVVGEEWGFFGSSILLILYTYFIIRIYSIAEQQSIVFNRVFGYCIASIFLTHFIINIGMVIGLFPTVGIPLPYFSYGGSSLITFSMMFFTFLRLNFFDKRF